METYDSTPFEWFSNDENNSVAPRQQDYDSEVASSIHGAEGN